MKTAQKTAILILAFVRTTNLISKFNFIAGGLPPFKTFYYQQQHRSHSSRKCENNIFMRAGDLRAVRVSPLTPTRRYNTETNVDHNNILRIGCGFCTCFVVRKCINAFRSAGLSLAYFAEKVSPLSKPVNLSLPSVFQCCNRPNL